ncbi:alpha/beta fold hydrolase [Lactiplantibacillus garii]|uniref:Alpha/beta fold hydrolase n=1 Tax=Lactiplantibacillus garii TaxID=2306423 RepID=A0A3R8L1X0_9LACO|nr:alpha/beta fold hydrolase [Lactiplantibacillus garii]RRK10873.1 alpha/beta fold hydrolase [Lactiplantibacillus garii]
MLSVKQQLIQDVPTIEVVDASLIDRPLPLVIFYHGWRSQKDLVLTQARKLANKRLRVVLPDAMNHGDRQEPVSSLPSFTFWNSIQGNLAEFDLLVSTYRDRGLILDGKIGVGGYSMGGMTTGALLTQHPEITAATIIMGTPNLNAYAQLVRDYAAEHHVYLPTSMAALTSWIDHFDLNRHPEKIANRPVLFWHGTADERIPYEQSRDFFDRVHTAPYASQVAFITGYQAKHLVKIPLMNKIANFFDYYLN